MAVSQPADFVYLNKYLFVPATPAPVYVCSRLANPHLRRSGGGYLPLSSAARFRSRNFGETVDSCTAIRQPRLLRIRKVDSLKQIQRRW